MKKKKPIRTRIRKRAPRKKSNLHMTQTEWLESEGLIYKPPSPPQRPKKIKSLPGQQQLFD